MRVFPWIRLCHVNIGENFETIKRHLDLLATTALFWGEDTIVPNYEDEASVHKPESVADYLYGTLDWGGHVGWSTLAWLQNDLNWSVLNRDPALLQIFPQDNRWSVDEIQDKQDDCVAHARDLGFTYVGVTFQTYGDPLKAQPDWYDLRGSHSVFPGNVIAHGEWDNWFPPKD